MSDFNATFDALKLPLDREGGTAFEIPLVFRLIETTSNLSDGCCADRMGAEISATRVAAILSMGERTSRTAKAKAASRARIPATGISGSLIGPLTLSMPQCRARPRPRRPLLRPDR